MEKVLGLVPDLLEETLALLSASTGTRCKARRIGLQLQSGTFRLVVKVAKSQAQVQPTQQASGSQRRPLVPTVNPSHPSRDTALRTLVGKGLGLPHVLQEVVGP